MNRRRTPAERQARSELMKAAWRAGKFANRRKLRHRRAWTPAEDRALRELGGTMPLGDLVALWRERFEIPRNAHALRIRAKRIDVSLYAQGLGLTHLERIFRLNHRAIVRNWIKPGLLRGRRWSGRGPNRGWWFEQAEVERFILECGHAYNWRRVQHGRWRRLADLAYRADPWRSYQDLARYVGISDTNLDRWRRRGLVPHERRPKGGPGMQIMVRGRLFKGIKLAIETARELSKERTRRLASERFRTAPRDERGWILPESACEMVA